MLNWREPDGRCVSWQNTHPIWRDLQTQYSWRGLNPSNDQIKPASPRAIWEANTDEEWNRDDKCPYSYLPSRRRCCATPETWSAHPLWSYVIKLRGSVCYERDYGRSQCWYGHERLAASAGADAEAAAGVAMAIIQVLRALRRRARVSPPPEIMSNPPKCRCATRLSSVSHFILWLWGWMNNNAGR